jgi:hypothetical protein
MTVFLYICKKKTKDIAMELKDIKSLEKLQTLTAGYFNTLQPVQNEKDIYNVKIKVGSYYELGCIITNMIKSSILALDQNTAKDSNYDSINVVLLLETVLQLFPINELEFLDRINELK